MEILFIGNGYLMGYERNEANSNFPEDKMKKGAIIFLLAFTLIAIFSIYQCSSAQDFKIEKVIEIGPADWVPLLWPIKWSPDGTKISYFSKGYLMISDTLGNSHQVMKVDMMPFRYEWVSKEEIAITFKGQEKAGAIPYKLSLFNIDNASETVLEQFMRNGSGDDSVIISDFNGPYKAVEGGVYYHIAKSAVAGDGDYKYYSPSNLKAVPIQSKLKTASKSSSLADNHFVRWGNNGLFKIDCVTDDSVAILANFHPPVPLAPAVKSDFSYVMYLNTIYCLADSQSINLDKYLIPYPENTKGCGASFASFNPVYNEVLFQIACDDGVSYEVNRIGTFNYVSNRFSILDSSSTLVNCIAPVFSPNGINIAVIANYKVCIIVRRAE